MKSPRRCFVMMPFAPQFDGIWQTVINPTVKNHGDECQRGDDIYSPGGIMADVIDSIVNADYLIADLTDHNPNVFYELGYAHALKKPVILLTQNIEDIPFDLRHERCIHYVDTAAGASQLKQEWLIQPP